MPHVRDAPMRGSGLLRGGRHLLVQRGIRWTGLRRRAALRPRGDEVAVQRKRSMLRPRLRVRRWVFWDALRERRLVSHRRVRTQVFWRWSLRRPQVSLPIAQGGRRMRVRRYEPPRGTGRGRGHGQMM